MRTLTLIGLMGCISPGIQLTLEDTGISDEDTPGGIDTGDTTDPEDTNPDDTDTDDPDTDDPDTDDPDTDDTDTDDHDTDDTDDMDSDLEVDMDYGLPFMRDTYLIFDGSMVLGSSHSLTGSSDPILSNFLKVDADWGFAVSIGPYNHTSHQAMLDDRIALFRANNSLITLDWNFNGSVYIPILNMHRFGAISGGPTEKCENTIFSNGNSGNGLTEAELINGYRIYMTHETYQSIDEPPISYGSFTLYVHSSDGLDESFTLMSQGQGSVSGVCSNLQSDDHIFFGKGVNAMVSIVPGETSVSVPDLQARVDDLVIFNPVGIDAYVNVPDQEGFLQDIYVNDGSAFLNLANQAEDGWHWYPVDTERQNKFNEVWDETLNNNDNYQFRIMDVNGTQIPSAEGLYYYYQGNGRWTPNFVFKQDLWERL